jgi:hypothetical protein
MRKSEKEKNIKKFKKRVFLIQGRIEFYATYFLLIQIFFYFHNHEMFSKAFFFQ